jgi:hypothetical protein
MYFPTRKKNQEGHKVKRHVKSASLALITCAASVFAESTYEDVVKKKYHFAEWGGTSKAEYSHCLKRVPLESLVLPTNGMDIVVRHKEDRLLVFSKGKTLIDVRTSARDSILAAHTVLIERFSLMASTRLMKPCQTIGDVCFVDTGEGWSSVVFARNNVEANVCSRTLLINAMDIAAQIDGKILEASIPVGADALRKAAGATDRRGAADMDAGKGDSAGHRGKVPVLLDSQCAPGCTNHLLRPAQNPEMVAATNVAERAKKGCHFATAQ